MLENSHAALFFNTLLIFGALHVCSFELTATIGDLSLTAWRRRSRRYSGLTLKTICAGSPLLCTGTSRCAQMVVDYFATLSTRPSREASSILILALSIDYQSVDQDLSLKRMQIFDLLPTFISRYARGGGSELETKHPRPWRLANSTSPRPKLLPSGTTRAPSTKCASCGCRWGDPAPCTPCKRWGKK